MDGNVAPSPPSQPNNYNIDDNDNSTTQMPLPVQPSQEPLMFGSGELPPRDSQYSSNSTASRSRTSSGARPPPQQPQPIRNAVSNAFQHSHTTNHLDPTFIAHVTEQVIRNLQQANIGNANPQPPSQNKENEPRSPTQSSTTAFSEPRYTPPVSPLKEHHQSDPRRYASVSPDVEPSDDGGSSYSTHSKDSQVSLQSTDSGRSEATPRPFKDPSSSNPRAPRRSGSGSGDDEPRRRKDTHRFHANSGTSPRRPSQNSETSVPYMDGATNPKSRPSQAPEEIEETILEKVWQPLFDNGNPTMRLGQFLRGIAIHLIDDYEPTASLVVTPKKMARFFEDTKVNTEHYPWALIFDGGMMNKSISTMYRGLLCQHHLVQVQNHAEPTVPALTPSGFEWFMTCLIQAHPDTEFARLSNTVMNMPISNSDNKKERFPKELSRRLLPAQPNLQAAQRLVASLAHEPSVTAKLSNNSAMPPPPPASGPPPTSAPQQSSGPPREEPSFSERIRQPYSRTYSSTFDDEDLEPAPRMPIERERKPYTAGEGTGKNYGSDDERDDERRPHTSQYRPAEYTTRPHRAASNVNPPLSTYGTSAGSSEARSIPQANNNRHRFSHTGPPPSMYNGNSNINNPPHSSSMYGRPHRRSSPPPHNPYVRSDPLDLHDIPSSQYASNLHSNLHSNRYDHHFSDPGTQDDANLYRRGGNPTTRTNDFDPRGYPIPGRQPQQPTNYEPGFPPPPSTSYGTPNTTIPLPSPSNHDDRRRSAYFATTNPNYPQNPTFNPSGSDGYGSFPTAGGGPLLGQAGNGGPPPPPPTSNPTTAPSSLRP
ncbi:hypothetical protein MBLNU230_g8484t1 [Neophaeotheca triangularis]